ncbi:hypothetical protein ACEQ8H_001367 [Pleosporales sp. CAS-2024a]
MPDKPLTIATYAAGASLAAITLVYVFGPTFFIDDHGATTRRKRVVGLSNAANDCFINAVLQALAGLPDLRIYLIRETHRRTLDAPDVYEVDPDRPRAPTSALRPAQLEGLQQGLLTYGLKDMLDALNERPICRKTISPQPFIRALERAFGTRISRQQQDAHEFLQIVTERLCDEYHAGTRARRQASKRTLAPGHERTDLIAQFAPAPPRLPPAHQKEDLQDAQDAQDDEPPCDEDGFPFEGKIESQIECETCHFKPKPSVSTFVTLTLNVPQVSSTSLNACFDGMLKQEYIDDFRCERCRLEHALRSKDHELSQATDEDVKQSLRSDMANIRQAMEEDPENPLHHVTLPDARQAPKRRISRHMYISQFPKVLAIHLSRSVYAVGSLSTKNLAKVAFPESLPLGGLLHRKNYRLLAAVTHKGSHNSGHYEAFRRQVQPLPFSTPVSFGTEGAYSRQASPYPSARPSAVPSAVQSPRISSVHPPATNGRASPVPSIPTLDSPSLKSLSSQDSMTPSSRAPAPTSAPREMDVSSLKLPSLSSGTDDLSRTRSLRSLKDKASERAASMAEANPLKRKSKKTSNRWWGISDDKVKESKTSEVLARQKEVYLLFYELDRSDGSPSTMTKNTPTPVASPAPATSTKTEDAAFLQAPPYHAFSTPPRILVIGAGSRGTSYAEAALSCSNAVIAGICEPNAYKRNLFGSRFIWSEMGVPQAGQSFSDWREWVKYEKGRQESLESGAPIIIDAVFVCVLDTMHEEVVCGIAGLGVSVCVEKPLGTTLEGCKRMYKALKDAETKVKQETQRETVFGICHVLRYSPHNMMLRHLVLDREVIGHVLSIEHVEPVGWWHFSHSYVRGNWRKESSTAPSLLTKSCHDIDFLMWMLCSQPSKLADAPPHLPSHITSTGSRKFFRNARKPKQAGNATNCLSCPHEPDCIYSAKKIYVDKHLTQGITDWPVSIVNPEIEDIFKTKGKEAAVSKLLENLAEDYTTTTPTAEIEARPWFGRCVWESDNDVCDDQSVSITWADDPLPSDGNELRNRGAKTAQFHMVAFTEKQCERRGRIYGTAGEIEYDSTTIKVHDFSTGQTVTHRPHLAGGGHGGGDEGLVRQFLKAVNAVHNEAMPAARAQREFLGCDLDEALRSHAVVFAAEEARIQANVVEWGKWWKERVRMGEFERVA